MKKPTKEQVKGLGVKAIVGTVMTGQSLVAGKFASSYWKKDKKKAGIIAGASALVNIGLLASESTIEKKVCSLGSKKAAAADVKTDATQN